MISHCKALLIAMALTTGGASSALAATVRINLESGGFKRSAVMIEHARLKRHPRTVVIALHGQNGNGLRVRRNLGLEEIVRKPSVVTVYPDALDGHWDIAGPGNMRDMQFIHDLIQKLVSDGVADRKRIFVVGVSTGGVLAMRVACRYAESVAGAAALLSLMPASEAAACKPARPMPFLLMAGVADALVPYGGGKANLNGFKEEVVSADATLAPFLLANGCASTKTTNDMPDRDPKDGSIIRIDRYQSCKAPVELVRIEGGGHSLPGRVRPLEPSGTAGTPANTGAHNNDYDAAKLVWEFFHRPGGG